MERMSAFAYRPDCDGCNDVNEVAPARVQYIPAPENPRTLNKATLETA